MGETLWFKLQKNFFQLNLLTLTMHEGSERMLDKRCFQTEISIPLTDLCKLINGCLAARFARNSVFSSYIFITDAQLDVTCINHKNKCLKRAAFRGEQGNEQGSVSRRTLI